MGARSTIAYSTCINQVFTVPFSYLVNDLIHSFMKQDIHPPYFDKVTVTCSCGNSFETGSTDQALQIEVCSQCHPFYTGKSKMVDAAGRVDRFQQRLKESQERQKAAKKTTHRKHKKSSDDSTVKLS